MVLFGALAGLACHGDPTENEGAPTSIVAQPRVIFVPQGTTEAIIVSVVDEDGQSLQADFTVENVGTGITVEEDPTYLGVSSANQIRRQARFFVTGQELTATTFVVNALGLSETIEVTSIPPSLAATISNPTPALGDTISLTAPAGTFFTAESQLTFEGAMPFIVSQDATTIVFIPFPNIDGPAVVSNVGVTSNPDLTFSLATTTSVKTDSITNVGAGLSSTAPALGAPVTLTLPAGLRVIPESLPSLTVANAAVAPIGMTVSADSSVITFVPPPNADSFVVVQGVVPQRLAQCCTATRIFGIDTIPGYALQLPTTAKVTTPVVDSVPATLSNATPALGEEVTLTRTDAAFAFNADAAVTVGGPVIGTSVAPDGSSISFVPLPGSTGGVTVAGVTIAGFSLTLPAKAPSITVPPVTPIAGTGDPSTAPGIAVPGPGGTTRVFDDAVFTAADITGDGGVGAQYYSITVGAPTTLTITIGSGDSGPDLDGVLCSDVACTAPDFTLASVAHDESAEVTLAAGTHILAVVNFDGAPTDVIFIEITQ
jgi:hypothetical protein